MKLKFVVIFLISYINVFGQNKSFTLGYHDNGIALGNSRNCNGVRINLWDKEVNNVNGFNISAKSYTERTNGFSFGVVANSDDMTNGIKIAGFSNVADEVNGICIAGLATDVTNKINGLGISGFYTFADTMNGVFISLLGIINFNRDFINVVNGLSVGMFTDAENFRGLALGFQSRLDTLNGVSMGLVRNESNVANGIQFGMQNKTQDLFGFQIGFWNVAENKRHFKKTPIINFNFRKKASR